VIPRPIVTAHELAVAQGTSFPRTVDGVEVELRWDQPERSAGASARASWSLWEKGESKTRGHASADAAVHAWRKGRSFDAWWNRPRGGAQDVGPLERAPEER